MADEPARRPTISVCVPAQDHVATGFMNDLARMMAWTSLNLTAPGHIEGLQLNVLSETLIHTGRQRLAETALAHDVDYILWLDSDMRFPADTLHRLLSRREPFVGVNYSTRGVPPKFTASVKVKWGPDEERIPCVTDENASGLEEVEGMGLGVTLIRSDVFAALPEPRGENRPWFWYDYHPEIDAHMGEDVYFCRAAREAGFTPKVDHDLSRLCSHIGSFEYTPMHVAAMEGLDVED